MNRVVKIQVKSWNEPEKGVVLHENEDFLLVHHFAIDYIIDGFRIYRKAFIESIFEDEEVFVTKKVLEKRSYLEPDILIPSRDFVSEWKQLVEKYSLIELHDQNDNIFYVRNFSSLPSDIFIVDEFGKKVSGVPFDFPKAENIVCLAWAGDYFDAISILSS